MPDRVLITGACGFLGSVLERCATGAGADCLGIGRSPRLRPGYRAIDLSRETSAIVALLCDWRPDIVFHMAGTAADDLCASYIAPTRNLLRALREVQPHQTRIVVVGSAAEYGDLGPDPLSEDARERPVSEYGAIKLAQTRLALVFRRTGLQVTVVRPFNIIGPGMSTELAPARFARAALLAVRTGGSTISVGNLTTVRDYLHVDDAARALWAVGQHAGREEIVNVCSGQGVSTRAVLDEVVRQAGGTLEARTDPTLVKGPADVPVSIGSVARLEALTGVTFSFSLSHAIADLVGSLRESPTSPPGCYVPPAGS